MTTENNFIPESTIEKFAEKNSLTMEVHERRKAIGDADRFYAHFKGVEVKGDGVLIGSFGNGRTPEEAISDYAREINLKTIIIDSMNKNRREIQVPRLVKEQA